MFFIQFLFGGTLFKIPAFLGIKKSCLGLSVTASIIPDSSSGFSKSFIRLNVAQVSQAWDECAIPQISVETLKSALTCSQNTFAEETFFLINACLRLHSFFMVFCRATYAYMIYISHAEIIRKYANVWMNAKLRGNKYAD